MKKLILMFVLIFSPSVLVAQEIQDPTPQQIAEANGHGGPSISSPASIEGAVNCFDYYKFGSVQVDIQSEISNTVSGVPLLLKGKVNNANDYPIVNGKVFVKVFRKQNDDNLTQQNGFFLVDQFVAKENISLNSMEEQDISFEWKIPSFSLSGEYQIATFFISDDKFNLLGLSFTDDVVGNTFNFTVNSELKENVEFDKNDVKINDNNYSFAAFPPRVRKEENALVKVKLVNSTKENQTVPVTFTLYSWDAQQKENIVEKKEEQIQLTSGQVKDLEYTVKENENPVYLVVLEAKYKDSKSILGIRFVKSDVNKVRLNFPAVTSYPIKKDQSMTVFSCLHNSGQADKVENNKLILTLLDEEGKEIHKYEYSGAVSGAMMGLKDDFTPEKDYENFTLKAELFTDGKLMDSSEMKYDCNLLDPEICNTKIKQEQIAPQKTVGVSSETLTKLVLALVIIILSFIFFMVIRKRKSN